MCPIPIVTKQNSRHIIVGKSGNNHASGNFANRLANGKVSDFNIQQKHKSDRKLNQRMRRNRDVSMNVKQLPAMAIDIPSRYKYPFLRQTNFVLTLL
jgi:hypothetical protein